MLKLKQTHESQARRVRTPALTDQPDFEQLIRPVGGREFMEGLEDKRTDIIFLDPPDQIDQTVRQISSSKGLLRQSAETLHLLVPVVDRILEDNGFVFWFPPDCPFATTTQLENAIPAGIGFRRMIWIKSCSAQAVVRKKVRMCHELFYLIWPSGRNQPIPHQSLPDVLRFIADDHDDASLNQCIKPVALFERLIKACSHAGANIVDPFARTGTSIEAALRLGRNALGAELDSKARAKAKERLTRLRPDFSDDPVTAAFVNEKGIEQI